MAAVRGVGALCSLSRLLTLERSVGLIPVQFTSICLPRRLCSAPAGNYAPKPLVNIENESLLENLNLMGVDVKMARQRQPGVFRKIDTNEKGIARFLQSKGASKEVIASIISRYPRAITRSMDHMNQRWELWRNIFKTDDEIVKILARSPESFFRSSDNENLEDNINFLMALGLDTKHLHRMLTTAPRTFSNSVELNKQMLEFLEDICEELGGEDPKHFAKAIIAKNIYILIRSTKRVRTNIDLLRVFLNLSDSELVNLLEGHGAEILDLSSECLKRNLTTLQRKMDSHGGQEAGFKKLVISNPIVLYLGAKTLSSKLDCLLNGGITMKQIVEKPKVLDYSAQNIKGRLEVLQKVGYDFQKYGLHILDSSQKRFDARIEKFSASPDKQL